jgi:hypothetical protein
VRQADAVRLGNEAEESAVAVEAPWPARFDDLETRLVVPVEDFVRHAAIRPAIHKGQCAEPIHPTLATVTRQSGKMPLTEAVGRRSSSLLIARLMLRLCVLRIGKL